MYKRFKIRVGAWAGGLLLRMQGHPDTAPNLLEHVILTNLAAWGQEHEG